MKTIKVTHVKFVNCAYISPIDELCRLIFYFGDGTANNCSFCQGLAGLTFPGQSVTIKPGGKRGRLSIIAFPDQLLPSSIHTDESPAIVVDPGDSFMRYFEVSCSLLSEHPNNGAEHVTVTSLLAWFTSLAPREPEPESAGAHSRQMVEQAKEIIHREYASDLTLQTVAAELFVNPCYLSTVFHQVTGSTFRTYLKSVRLHHTCRLLTQTNHLITDIAMQTGFNSTAYLISSFRKEFGVTPNAYRAIHSER